MNLVVCYAGSRIRFKISMLKSSLCDDSGDAYIPVKGTITTARRGVDVAARQEDERNKGEISTNCGNKIKKRRNNYKFHKCVSEINDMQVDDAREIGVVMAMYNLIEHSDNYSKTSRSLWKYYRDEPNANLADSESFKSNEKVTGKSL